MTTNSGKQGGQRMTLDSLVDQLARAHDASLTAVVLYGSAAGNAAIEGHSDLNVLVVVDAISIATLQQLGATARAWQEAGNATPLTLTRAEWERSADIFPMEYADILERHRVLHGALPLDGVRVDIADLRLQTEQEAMGKLLRLRRAVMAAGTDTGRQRELLRVSVSSLLVIFRAVLRLHGERPPRDNLDVANATAQRVGFDPTAFQRAIRFAAGTAIADRDVEPALAAYVQGMETLVRYLDGFDAASAASYAGAPTST